MIDHVYIAVDDIARAREFNSATLSALGWSERGQFESSTEGVPDLLGFGDHAGGSDESISSSIWLR